MSIQPDQRRDRIKSLDGLRGIAVIMIIFYHYVSRYHALYGHPFNIPGFLEYGKYSVHLFFIISGFVIVLTAEKTTTWKFCVNRFSRLYPAYWTAVIISLIFITTLGLPGKEVSNKDALMNVFMFQHYLGAQDVDHVYRTLVIELRFYFIVSILISFNGIRHIFWICIGWLVLIFIFPFMTFHRHWTIEQVLLLDHGNRFIIGIAMYLIWKHGHKLKYYLLCAAASAVEFLVHHEQSGIAVFILCFIFWFATNGYLNFLGTRIVVFIGYISYPLYLLHKNIGYSIFIQGYGNGISPWIFIPVTVLLIFGMAWLIHKFIEYPAMYWIRNKLLKRNTSKEKTV